EVADLYPGGYWSNPSAFVEHQGVAYFVARAPTEGRFLWRSDGSAAGTWRVATASGVQQLTVAGGSLYFGASSGGSGVEPWTSDGTPAGTRALGDLAAGPAGSGPRGFAAV